MPAPASSTLHFWPWDRPVLTHAVEELTRPWTASGALDLTDTIIICPTEEAVRRLRQSLAEAAAERDSAVMAPHVWHPASALAPSSPLLAQTIAPPLQERIAWTHALKAAPLEEMRALFPALPETQDLAWASAVAETLRKVRHALGAGGHSLQSAAGDLASMDDAERWQALAALEEAYLLALSRWNLQDAQEAKRRAAVQPVLPAGVTRVLVFAVADAPPLFLTWLRALSSTIAVDIFVHAPESERTKFSELGVPLPEAWGDEAVISCPVSHDRMHRMAGPEDQARLAVHLLTELAAAPQPVAIGTCDPALASVLEGTLTAQGARVYNPSGRSARQHIITQVLRTGWKAAHSPSWRAWLPFLRMDDVLRAICREAKLPPASTVALEASADPTASTEESSGKLSLNRVLRELDEFHAQHLPPTLKDAVALSGINTKFSGLHAALTVAEQRAEHWGAPSCAQAIREILLWLYGERKFDTSRDTDRHFGELFGEALRLADEVDAVRGHDSPADWMSHVLDALQEGQMADLRGEVDLVLHGWLELPWEPAPGLVITGFNDEHIPGSPGADPFLPDKARQKLGLSCQATRRARDGYLFRAMAEQRRETGALHVILGRVSSDQDALRPSRLLLDASDADLPDRVRHLFPREEEESAASPRPRRISAFQLHPPLRQWKKDTISAYTLKRYLACPFRFYLSDVLGMRAVESGQRELSPMDFGNVVHAVLESFSRDKAMPDSTDENRIASWLIEALETQAHARLGGRPLFPVALQIESMRQRLRAFAKIQAELRADGWRIITAEENFGKEWGLSFSGVPFTGKIDRIDRNVHTGMLRVIDYKTSKSEKGPSVAHYRKAKPHEQDNPGESWKCFEDAKDVCQRWTDLQLPLYVAAVARKWPDAPGVETAYITLPATVEDVKLRPWENLSADVLSSATDCAEEAVSRIQQGIFWPPAADLKLDDFSDILADDAVRHVVPQEFWKEVAA